ncbi:hypothetical protein TetV_325 [Tetraselmis virus 1]|uniref:Uncharacterized protein n=1 Tax=Tetraselmis virus 1 TaxID=2060617 RepID=A0A2P0VND5_9VIRU|nr:hypothetical protein QJ968_gp325 [Tetraselmis virus 1]AUF82417.1 hypothetical protein TetV_325 [Tetraselmis virus 1]
MVISSHPIYATAEYYVRKNMCKKFFYRTLAVLHFFTSLASATVWVLNEELRSTLEDDSTFRTVWNVVNATQACSSVLLSIPVWETGNRTDMNVHLLKSDDDSDVDALPHDFPSCQLDVDPSS